MPEKDKIIIDTNLWISFLLTKDLQKLDKIFSDNAGVLLFSQELLSEFIEVTRRPKFKKYFSASDVRNLLNYVDMHAMFILVISNVNICRDPKDNFLLSLASDGMATHILTGDKDLLDLQNFNRTRIQTISEYLLNK